MRILFAVLIALLAVAVGEANAMERVLTYSDHEPLGNMRTAFLNDVFFKNIEKESHGKLKIEPHWNSELSTGYDALKKTKDGTLESRAGWKGLCRQYAVAPAVQKLSVGAVR